MPRIALVTALAAADLDTDLAPLTTALERRSAEAVIASWDDTGVEWTSFDAAVLRSTWDYPQRLGSFLEWVTMVSTATRLVNAPDVVRWNVDKRYLADLAEHGIPTVPTEFLTPGDRVDLPDDVEVVIKPAISAGSRNTARFAIGDPRARSFAIALLEEARTVMVQPYQSAVDTRGEHALICFDGVFSHAFHKGPILRVGESPAQGLFAEEEIGDATVTEAEMTLAEQTVAAVASIVGTQPVFARVDIVPGDSGEPLLLELELVEPSLYHHVDPESADRFAASILRTITPPY